jgi:hypothetical protein
MVRKIQKAGYEYTARLKVPATKRGIFFRAVLEASSQPRQPEIQTDHSA